MTAPKRHGGPRKGSGRPIASRVDVLVSLTVEAAARVQRGETIRGAVVMPPRGVEYHGSGELVVFEGEVVF